MDLPNVYGAEDNVSRMQAASKREILNIEFVDIVLNGQVT
jgi:hypothetical protein